MAGYRAIANQQFVIAGVLFGLVVAFRSGAYSSSLLIGCTSLAIFAAIGLILVEMVSGSIESRAAGAVVSCVYHIQTWALVLGISGLAAHAWGLDGGAGDGARLTLRRGLQRSQ